MPASLPPNPDLEQLKNLARDLQRAYRDSDPQAIARVDAGLPRYRDRALPLPLSAAQTVVAREHGFASWPRLKQHVEGVRATPRPAHISRRSLPEIRAVLDDLVARQAVEEYAETFHIGRRKSLALRDQLFEEGELTPLVDMLLAGVRHHNPKVRFECAHAMDMYSDERCAGALLELLDDPVPRVRRIAVHSIACDDCKITPLQAMVTSRSGRPVDLVERVVALAMDDPSIQVRRHATVALAMFTDVRSTAAAERIAAYEQDEAMLRAARDVVRRMRASA